MSRGWVIAGVLLLSLLASPAHAQAGAQGSATGGMLGLPLVIREGGWARYVATSSMGPTLFVVKVGAPGKHKGKAGRWIHVEIDVPATGRLSLQFLIQGDRFTSQNVLLLRVAVPGQPPEDSEDAFAGAPAAKPPKQVRKGPETVAGKQIEVTEYAYPQGLTATWSPSIPGTGLVRISGPEPFELVAFGVGGDPWKGSAQAPQWPEPGPGPAPKK
ncbi:MAG TPA: hypothetical protein VE153_26815 [Myxococcus sp.]|nr:hypothetical protein [Myxococcus sp.]